MAPRPRSAHCLLSRRPDLLTFGGDTGIACQRLNDVWVLRTAADHPGSARWQCLGTSGEEPEPRSNCAAAVAGSKLFVFGGWDAAGTTPLASLGVLDLDVLQWLSLIEVTGQAPSPRGQPTMVATTCGQSLLVFGGWDGKRRYNDMYSLDANSMSWSIATPASDAIPPARADHSSAIWRYCDDGVWKDLMVCFGGCTDSGVQADVWLYDLRWHLWTEAFCAGEAPPKRSSHASAVVGDVLIVIGGQNGGQVFSDCHMLHLVSLTWQQVDVGGLPGICRHAAALCHDALWITGGFDGEQTLDRVFRLPLDGLVPPAKKEEKQEPADQQNIQEEGVPSKGGLIAGLKAAAAALLGKQHSPGDALDPRRGGERALAERLEEGCRIGESVETSGPHSAEGDWFEVEQLSVGASHSATATAGEGEETEAPGGNKDESGEHDSAPVWPEKQEPYTVADLSPEDQQLPGWKLVRKLHAAAVAAGRDQYVDPPSGYTVFTARYLERRPCCGNKCRHCPWSHANVKKDDW